MTDISTSNWLSNFFKAVQESLVKAGDTHTRDQILKAAFDAVAVYKAQPNVDPEILQSYQGCLKSALEAFIIRKIPHQWPLNMFRYGYNNKGGVVLEDTQVEDLYQLCETRLDTFFAEEPQVFCEYAQGIGDCLHIRLRDYAVDRVLQQLPLLEKDQPALALNVAANACEHLEPEDEKRAALLAVIDRNLSHTTGYYNLFCDSAEANKAAMPVAERMWNAHIGHLIRESKSNSEPVSQAVVLEYLARPRQRASQVMWQVLNDEDSKVFDLGLVRKSFDEHFPAMVELDPADARLLAEAILGVLIRSTRLDLAYRQDFSNAIIDKMLTTGLCDSFKVRSKSDENSGYNVAATLIEYSCFPDSDVKIDPALVCKVADAALRAVKEKMPDGVDPKMVSKLTAAIARKSAKTQLWPNEARQQWKPIREEALQLAWGDLHNSPESTAEDYLSLAEVANKGSPIHRDSLQRALAIIKAKVEAGAAPADMQPLFERLAKLTKTKGMVRINASAAELLERSKLPAPIAPDMLAAFAQLKQAGEPVVAA